MKKSEHLGLFGHALPVHDDALEGAMQADPAGAGAVQGQIAQVRRLEPFPHRQAVGPVAHVDLVLALGSVGPGEPEISVALARSLVQHDV